MRLFWLFDRQRAFLPLFALSVSLSIFTVCITAPAPLLAQEKTDQALETNEAQKLMLLKDHLRAIKKPTILRYSFERKSQKKDDSYQDTIDVKISHVHDDGAKDVSFDFFTGSRKRPYPDVTRFRSNALVMTSLTRDIWQMAREIGKHAQQASYFGKRINVAIRENPEVTDVTIDTDKGPIKAKKIIVRPFVRDYNIAKFKKFENKIYEFVFAADIPGELYMMRTLIPAGEAEKDSGPSVEEITKFQAQLPIQ